ncbi:MAG: carbohydrate porin [Candidatus Hydrogenedentes bacterium]|nr:carbohydrate porin [Candidatus Hydrogenedentota bacterium]
MKLKRVLLGCVVMVSVFAGGGARAALTPELQMYLRSSSGANGVGGAQECINNPGAWGNEFRLGNECATYGEFGFGAWVLKPAQDGDPFFRFFANFAVVYDNRTDWEAPSVPTGGGLRGGNVWVMREVYSEGGYYAGAPFTAWAGGGGGGGRGRGAGAGNGRCAGMRSGAC